jgi:hypothetical protein
MKRYTYCLIAILSLLLAGLAYSFPPSIPPSASSMVYPTAGIGVSTGTGWDTSQTSPSGAIVGTTDVQTLTNKTITMTEVDGHADGNLTAVQASNTLIYNTGQADANATIVMPVAAVGYSFIATVGTTRAGKAWCFQAKSTDLIYLDGTATADHGKACVTPAIGNYLTCFTFKTDAYDWICRTGIGTWWRE